MIAVGIDIGKEKHAVAILDGNGSLEPTRFYGNDRPSAEKLLGILGRLGAAEDVQIGMESTGSYWRPFHDILAKAGFAVHVINPIVTSASFAGDIRGRKTDKRDAERIAGVVLSGRTPAARAEGVAERRLKALTRQRGFLVGERTSFKDRLLSILGEAFPEFERLVEDPFSPFAAALLAAYPTAAALARAKRPAVAKIVAENTRGRDEAAEAERLVTAAKGSLAVDCEAADELGVCIRSTLASITAQDGRIAELDRRIEAFDPPRLAEIIMQVKGSGKLLPKVIAAEFGDVSRFATGRGMHKRMLAYAGSEPRIRESGKWRGTVRISKRGSGQLRTAGYLVANSIRIWDPFFKNVYERKRSQGKHHNVALFYVFAKLLEVTCSLYRSGGVYSAAKPQSKVVNNPISQP